MAALKERNAEILDELAALKAKLGLEFIFLSLLELEEGYNLFITQDTPAQELLNKILGITFTNHLAKRPGLMMRKELVPLLKNRLEKLA